MTRSLDSGWLMRETRFFLIESRIRTFFLKITYVSELNNFFLSQKQKEKKTIKIVQPRKFYQRNVVNSQQTDWHENNCAVFFWNGFFWIFIIPPLHLPKMGKKAGKGRKAPLNVVVTFSLTERPIKKVRRETQWKCLKLKSQLLIVSLFF